MAVEIIMPRLGWTMEQGVLTEWLKRDGDAVQPGDLLFTVESDKALQEVETFETGILRIPSDSPPVGSTVAVGTVIGYITAPGEALPLGVGKIELPSANSTARADVSPEQGTEHKKSVSTNDFSPHISPRARRLASELNVVWTMLRGSGRTGRIRESDVRGAAQIQSDAVVSPATAFVVTPVAQRVAQELGVDLAALAAKNPGKKITRVDIEQAALASSAPKTSEPTAAAPSSRHPLSRTRQVIAERMLASGRTTAPVTLTTTANATDLVRLCEQLRADAESANLSVPSFNDIFAKIAAHALGEHPAMNAQLEDDEIVLQEAVHIGIAVDTERGLLVPVLRDVERKSLRQVAKEFSALVQRVREGKASANDLTGGTFTITNLGMYEIEAFTPIINLPQTAILGIGAIKRTPIFDGDSDKVIAAEMLTLSLTFDHRLVDGAPAARFLQRIKQLVERPFIWLVR